MQLCPLRGLREQRKSVSTSTLQGVSSCYFSPDLEDERKQSEAFFYTDMFPMCAKGRIDLRRDLDFTDFAKLNCVETRMRLEFRIVRNSGGKCRNSKPAARSLRRRYERIAPESHDVRIIHALLSPPSLQCRRSPITRKRIRRRPISSHYYYSSINTTNRIPPHNKQPQTHVSSREKQRIFLNPSLSLTAFKNSQQENLASARNLQSLRHNNNFKTKKDQFLLLLLLLCVTNRDTKPNNQPCLNAFSKIIARKPSTKKRILQKVSY
jgi:hypothetical protein